MQIMLNNCYISTLKSCFHSQNILYIYNIYIELIKKNKILFNKNFKLYRIGYVFKNLNYM